MSVVDKIVVYAMCTFVFTLPLTTYVSLNIMTRPDVITTVLEMPKTKPVTTIYEPIEHGAELPDWSDRYQWTDQHEEDYEQALANLQMEQEFSASFEEPPVTEDDLLCMAKNIYFESKNQTLKGQVAVGLVTLNRAESRYYPDNVCDVVYQSHQFSWYWDGKPDRPHEMEAFEQAMVIASALLSKESNITDFTYGSDHYHADYVEPKWKFGSERHDMVYVTQIETHIFYRQELRNTSL